MVGSGRSRMSSDSRVPNSKKLILGPQRLDDRWACHGLDQHEDYFGSGLLRCRHPHGNVETVAGKRSHGSTAKS